MFSYLEFYGLPFAHDALVDHRCVVDIHESVFHVAAWNDSSPIRLSPSKDNKYIRHSKLYNICHGDEQ